MFFALSSSTVYYEERFNQGWEQRWFKPEHVRKGVQLGRVRLTSGDFHGDERKQRGIQTMDKERYYLLYSNFSHTMDTRGKDLIVQYTLRMHYYVDCASQYIKLFRADTDMTRFSNETKYEVMFGPDVCGATFRRTHVILRHNGKEYPTLHPLNCLKDHLTHSYTLILRRNSTYEVQIDGETIDESRLEDRFAIPSAEEIPDATSHKPDDWEDDEYITDPNDKKPSTWVEEEYIVDPDAFKPPDWDDTIPWQAPLIRNPDYKGQWKASRIKNPGYKGVWQPAMRPQHVERDPQFGTFANLGYLGLELFQHKPGSIFDNFLVTDDESYAREMLEDEFLSIRQDEVRDFDEWNERSLRDEEIERLRRDKDEESHHDPDTFTNSQSSSEEDYFQVRRGAYQKSRADGKKPEYDQFDML